jgi:hypothetical protein
MFAQRLKVSFSVYIHTPQKLILAFQKIALAAYWSVSSDYQLVAGR